MRVKGVRICEKGERTFPAQKGKKTPLITSEKVVEEEGA